MRAKQNGIVVWGNGTPRTMRVYWALHELKLEYRSKPLKPRTADMDGTEFLAVSPGKKIPGFQHDELTLTESGAIVFHLYQRFAEAGFINADFAKISRWSFFALMELDATALYVMRRHRDLPQIYGDAPAAISSCAEYFQRQAEVINDELSDGREFVVGRSLTPADIFIVSCCDWAIAYDLPLPDILAGYHARLQQRSAYIEATKLNASML
jgi:glutathione S-transferase